MIVGIDPGPIVQSCVLYDESARRVAQCQSFSFPAEIDALQCWMRSYPVACEWVESFGMAVGKEVFQTVFNIGVIHQALNVRLIPRKDVKLFLCQSMRAKDANIRQSLIDELGVVGTKKNRGPLFGVSQHYWAALAVAYTAASFAQTEREATFHKEVCSG